MLYLVGELTISDPILELAGEVNKVAWTVGTENGTEVDDFPDAIQGGHYLREWIESKGYYAKLYNMGKNDLQPLVLTWNGLTLEKAIQLFNYYTKRKHVIADYREFSGKLARIVDMKAKPFWGSDFVGVAITIVEVPAFRVYRSTDYGASYQQASDRVNNEFYDYGFVYAGQVRYRIQYEPPDTAAKFDGFYDYTTLETTRNSTAEWKRNVDRVEIIDRHVAGGGTGNTSGDFKLDYPIASVGDVVFFAYNGSEMTAYPISGADTTSGVYSVEMDTAQGVSNGNMKFFLGNGSVAIPVNIEGVIVINYIPTTIPRNRTLGLQYDLPVTSIAGAMKISDIFVTHDPSDVQTYDVSGVLQEYRPIPVMTVEGVWHYSAEGLTPAIKVTFDYPTNAFDLYPTTAIQNEHLEGEIEVTSGIEIVNRDGVNPFFCFLEDGIGAKPYIFTAWSRNVYGCSLPSFAAGSVEIPAPPYYDKWFVELTGSTVKQNANYTNVIQNNRFETVYTSPYDEIYLTELQTESGYSPPPGFNELDGGTHSDVLTELAYKDVYAGEITQASDYSEIHYT